MFKKWLEKIYIKWIKGQCRHLCCLCDYKNVCDEEFYWEDNE